MLTGVAQVAIVTADLDRYMRTLNDKYGVGPWHIYDWQAHPLDETTIAGQPARFVMRAGHSSIGDTALEVIQPLDDVGIYAESLRRHDGRDHLHHLLLTSSGFDDTKAWLDSSGIGSAQGGCHEGIRFDYMDTLKDLGFWIEIAEFPEGMPVPDDVYPRPDAS